MSSGPEWSIVLSASEERETFHFEDYFSYLESLVLICKSFGKDHAGYSLFLIQPDGMGSNLSEDKALFSRISTVREEGESISLRHVDETIGCKTALTGLSSIFPSADQALVTSRIMELNTKFKSVRLMKKDGNDYFRAIFYGMTCFVHYSSIKVVIIA